jgi:hypothetical protein
MNKVNKPSYLEDVPELVPKTHNFKKTKNPFINDVGDLDLTSMSKSPILKFEKSKNSSPIIIEEGFKNKKNLYINPICPKLFKKKQTQQPVLDPNQFTMVDDDDDDLQLLKMETRNLGFSKKNLISQENIHPSANEENPDSSHETGFQAHEFFLRKRKKNDLEKCILNFIRLDMSISKNVKKICMILKTLVHIYTQHRLRLSDASNLRLILSVAYYQDNAKITQNVFKFLRSVISFHGIDTNYSTLMK